MMAVTQGPGDGMVETLPYSKSKGGFNGGGQEWMEKSGVL